jgi:hypothetical protein
VRVPRPNHAHAKIRTPENNSLAKKHFDLFNIGSSGDFNFGNPALLRTAHLVRWAYAGLCLTTLIANEYQPVGSACEPEAGARLAIFRLAVSALAGR